MEQIVVFLVLLVLGYVFGRIAEKRHFKSIIERERAYLHLKTFSTKRIPVFKQPVEGVLVGGNVVVSIDYFKRVAAGLRAIFGGRVSAYESLLDRARREAVLRMKEDAIAKGAKAVFNLKLETSSISKGQKNQVGSVEVYAYGTGLIPGGALEV
ncbi:YbjQ family protein [Teredinibacter franksiae]|jgi:Uncharacterized conserved protein|uniref:YbjQ family protein n=1 Tax=Teredinibacter franksiae TaxID=2761453 RepID=UPI001627B840|nr:heavy metal-binding domain-containing protein [Teredinibacter franksiae]